VIAVEGVTGAPGDGDRSLARAIAAALRHANLRVADADPPRQSYRLSGRIEIAPPLEGRQQVKVRWALKRPDGGEIGQVSQENAVPAGSLDGPWGDVAYAVAMAAAPGIAALVERAKLTAAGS
jgi:hypothetical protein